MSVARQCGGCMRGRHDQHNANEGVLFGLVGGWYCPCGGECAEEFENRVAKFASSRISASGVELVPIAVEFWSVARAAAEIKRLRDELATTKAELGRVREVLNRRGEPLSEAWLTKLHERAHRQPSNRNWRIIDTLVHHVDRLTLDAKGVDRIADALGMSEPAGEGNPYFRAPVADLVARCEALTVMERDFVEVSAELEQVRAQARREALEEAADIAARNPPRGNNSLINGYLVARWLRGLAVGDLTGTDIPPDLRQEANSRVQPSD